MSTEMYYRGDIKELVDNATIFMHNDGVIRSCQCGSPFFWPGVKDGYHDDLRACPECLSVYHSPSGAKVGNIIDKATS